MTTDHPGGEIGQQGETGYQGHELTLWTGRCKAFVDGKNLFQARRCGINFEGLGMPRPAGSRKTSPNSFSMRKRQGRVSATIHDKSGLAQIEAGHHDDDRPGALVLKEGLVGHSSQNRRRNALLNGSTELDDVARALNMLDVESQEGIIKAAVKPAVRSHNESQKIQRKSAVRRRESNRAKKKSNVLPG